MPRGPAGDLPDYEGWLTRLRNERLEAASEKEYIEPYEAAHIIDVSSSAITRAIRKGHLPAQRYGMRGWLIARVDLDEYDRNRQRGRASPWYRGGELSKPPPEGFPFPIQEVTERSERTLHKRK